MVAIFITSAKWQLSLAFVYLFVCFMCWDNSFLKGRYQIPLFQSVQPWDLEDRLFPTSGAKHRFVYCPLQWACCLSLRSTSGRCGLPVYGLPFLLHNPSLCKSHLALWLYESPAGSARMCTDDLFAIAGVLSSQVLISESGILHLLPASKWLCQANWQLQRVMESPVLSQSLMLTKH